LLRGPERGAAADVLVVGLGNPGAEFERTRHNLGADALRLVAQRLGRDLRAEKGTRSVVAQADAAGRRVVLAVPMTYMNESGLAVSALVRRFRLASIDRLVVVHDELDLPSGRVKVKVGGGTAGNNGLKSVHAHLHDPGYVRVRIGIGKPPGREAGADYVLKRPGRAERETLDVAVQEAADAVEMIVSDGPDAAMARFNADAEP
jgi:PTH1 family peptidyl-tRNA hydrolase